MAVVKQRDTALLKSVDVRINTKLPSLIKILHFQESGGDPNKAEKLLLHKIFISVEILIVKNLY